MWVETNNENTMCEELQQQNYLCFSVLMKEPVLHDKQQEHVRFCKYAQDLLERVLGKQSNANFDASLEEIRRVCNIIQVGSGPTGTGAR